MGDKITISQSLLITVFSMLIVFIVLIAISYLIGLLRAATNKDKEKTEVENISNTVEKTPQSSKEEQNIDDEELVAVIAAAIAASMGVTIPDINIKSIKRVSTPSPIWAEMGRIEEISKKL
ncbi:OadG family protein [Clostridium sp. Cult3]|uniref:OadG family protein n=1 Tax=Clostridium sp. Cult3 TaxID=2079004 RepID=UPI001F471719|nr:OadG family protein [Clostridium sp. Cult3]MCF6461108.1 hypothetical protein [Clostridium sp. Cult3]